MADKTEAILSLQPNAKFVMVGDEVTEWFDDSITQPTEDEINAKIVELKVIENRKKGYGSIADQLDMQYWDAVNDTNNLERPYSTS